MMTTKPGKAGVVLVCVLALMVTASGAEKDEIAQLRQMIQAQQQQIDELRKMLEVQKPSGFPKANEPLATVSPMVPPMPEPLPRPVPAMPAVPPPPVPQKEGSSQEVSPLQLKIGTASLTPIGFMDFTAVARDTDPGSNIGTNFGGFPYRTAAAVNANLSEFRFSPQNSRIGMRIDALVKDTRVIGYWESDFLGGTGNPPVGNIAVNTNSYPLRLRLFWVDVKKDKWEVLGGQTWSMITPGRKGISPLPGDLFYSQVIDVNYIIGMPWGRIPELRFVYHPSEKDRVTFGLALDNPEQYIGGSGGAGVVALPTNLATPYGSQLNNATTTLGVPNLHPDIIAKLAFDPNPKLHFEVAGVGRTFKVYNPAGGQHFSKFGGGGSANVNFEIAKGTRVISNNYFSDGGGRYVFGQGPDVVVKGDGSLGLIHTNATSNGIEYTHKSTLFYGYYGMAWIGQNTVIDPANGKPVGYGYAGSANSQNKQVQEATIGFNQTIWKDAKFGALNLMGQYAYFWRNPWFVASGTPSGTHMNEVWLNLRYTLPGSAPPAK